MIIILSTLALTFSLLIQKTNAQNINFGLVLGSAVTYSQTPVEKKWEFNENIFGNYKAFVGYRLSNGMGIELRGGYAYPSSLSE